MANLSSIARPYALAAFEYAKDNQCLPDWKSFLETAAYVTEQPSLASLLVNTEVTSAQILSLYEEVLSSQLDDERRNFLLLVAQHKRFNVFREISNRFNEYNDELQKSSHIRLVTAVPAPQDFQDSLALALKKRLHHEVTLDCEVDQSIVAGAIVYIGDHAIDGSIRGKLNRLLETLTA